ncbi:MAG: RDD family protein [Deltaproteobacteria bacterium]|jgi:uncharacterized RDD family membrane protein YckC|nr:RDD family protein [Deltaproteobacteria bacterium]
MGESRLKRLITPPPVPIWQDTRPYGSKIYYNVPDKRRQKYLSEFSWAAKKGERFLMTPEGLPLRLELASRNERVTSLAVDLFIITSINVCISLLPTYLADLSNTVFLNLLVFVSFIINNCYFIFFELAWQGRTPGKKINHLRVINRKGGELTAFAVVARNLTRQLELFLPLLFLFGDLTSDFFWYLIVPLAWFIAITLFPFWNKDRLRVGDLIAGTVVISVPDKVLLPELADLSKKEISLFSFSKEQLSVYGSYELQILEEILRKKLFGEGKSAYKNVAVKIARKIAYPLPDNLSFDDYHLFLKEFYVALRAVLEEGRLYGRHKANKHSPVYQLKPQDANKPVNPHGLPVFPRDQAGFGENINAPPRPKPDLGKK